MGERMPLPYTRAMVRAIYNGDLDGVPLQSSPYFNLGVPAHVPDVPAELLDPRCTWKNCDDFDQQALALAQRFKENFTQFEGTVPPEVAAAGPVI